MIPETSLRKTSLACSNMPNMYPFEMFQHPGHSECASAHFDGALLCPEFNFIFQVYYETYLVELVDGD